MNMAMETIWAPWRLAYIKQDAAPPQPAPQPSTPCSDETCFLCRYWDSPTTDDAENLVICRSEQAFVVLNRFPYNNGHLLIAPRFHQGDLTEIAPDVQAECQQLLVEMVKLLRQTVNPDGFNVGLNLGRVAGAGLPGHLHWHIVPRWNGDTNFMPVIGDTKVIPQSLEALHGLLQSRWEANQTG